MTPAEKDVLAEREKQRERWGDRHDDEHDVGILLMAALRILVGPSGPKSPSWAYRWDDRPIRTRLVKACAFLLAEIDRLDRAAPHARDAGVS